MKSPTGITFSGSINALLVQMGAIDSSINFLGQRDASFEIMGVTMTLPLALTTVILFEAWRYIPFSFLFILARFQAIPKDMYEAADVDGASPLQKFWFITDDAFNRRLEQALTTFRDCRFESNADLHG